MRRPRSTEESRARAARIAQALAELLPDEPRPPGPAPQAARGPACPGCGAVMVASVSEAVEIDTCAGCGGIWLDTGELAALTETSVAPPPAGASDGAVRQVARSEEEIRYRECARCGEIMTRRNFGTISGVVIDECPRHGVFLDAGELPAIENFLRAGGQALGEAARRRIAAQQVPPRPPEVPETPKVQRASGGAVDVLWNLFFRW